VPSPTWGGGLRSVAWERASGQAVQALLTLAVLLLMAPPAGFLRLVVAVVVAAVAASRWSSYCCD
jgi:glycosyltransferase 2 family protein